MSWTVYTVDKEAMPRQHRISVSNMVVADGVYWFYDSHKSEPVAAYPVRHFYVKKDRDG